MSGGKYNIRDLEQFLSLTKGLYDVVRIIDPLECREIVIEEDGIHYKEGCYNVWDSGQRCRNCSSYKACMSGNRVEKEELFQDNVFHILSNPIQILLDDGTEVNCVIEFITSHKAQEGERERVNDRRSEAYESVSLTDTLTELLNWDGFHQEARRLLTRYADEKCLVIALDIMQFKLVNMLFGREKGNEILMEVAKVIQPYADEGAIVGRMHADQFAMCMPERLFDEQKLIDRILAIHDLLSDTAFRLKVHAGICETTEEELPVSVMFDRAVMALVNSREKNGSIVARFDASMMEELKRHQEVTSGFERTLAAGEYKIFIQPQVRADGVVIGGEALSRWVRPGGEVVPPFYFIPILEKAGLIAKLDAHVWELAAKQLKAWQGTEFADLHLSVNISALDFYYIDVYDVVTKLVKDYDIDVKKLKLEITETAIMSDAEKQILRVSDLREYGFDIEIDDFGAGYSSLAMLKDIEADVLKIDMGFLRETEHVGRSRKVLESIIKMAQKLGMTTITEGTETKEQVAMLADMGCEMFQGFYYSKPVPVEEFEEYVRKANKR